MSRPPSGPRLRLKSVGRDKTTGRPVRIWYIRDGAIGLSTGAREGELERAEAALSAYLVNKAHPPSSRSGARLWSPDEVTVADVIALYAAERAPMLADPMGTKTRLDALLNFFGEATLVEVTRSRCQSYVDQRIRQPIKSFKVAKGARTVSVASATRELEDLSAAISWWDGERRLTRPIKVWRPRKGDSPRDTLSREQGARLLLAALGWRCIQNRWRRHSSSARQNKAHLRRLILLGLYTGSRPGVLVRLKWEPSDTDPWVDLDNGWLRRKGRLEADQPTKRRPLCRLPRKLLVHLRRWKALDTERSRERQKTGLAPLTTVLHHGGRPLSNRVRRSFASAVKDAGLDKAITPHWLRHTAASWLMKNPDVSPQEAAEFLGMTVETLLKHYNHHRPDFQEASAKALDSGE